MLSIDCEAIQLFKNSVGNAVFPDIWKKSSIIPIQKVANRSLTGHEQIINRSLTIIDQCLFYKFVATLLSNSVFQFLHDNNLSSHQSGFRPLDSRKYHLLSIVMIFMHHLIITHLLNLEVYFWIYQKLLIGFDWGPNL